MNGGDQASNPNSSNQENNSPSFPVSSHSISNNNNSNSSNDSNKNNNSNEFRHSPTNYLDSNWVSSLLMDTNNDMLYNIDFSSANLPTATPSNAIAQNIQYHNPVQAPIQSLEDNKNNSFHSGTSNALGNGNNDNQSKEPSSQTSQAPTQEHQQQQAPPQQTKTLTKQRRPCDHCRRRKTKCVIIPNTNNCVQCESKSLTCTYIGQAAKRKTIDIDSLPVSKRRNDKSDSTNNLNMTNPNLALLQNDHSIIIPPNVPIRDVPPVQDYSVINNSLLKKTLSLQFPRSSFYVGPTSYLYDVNLLNLIIDSQNNQQASQNGTPAGNLGKIEQINLSNTISLRKVSDKVQFVLKDDQSAQSYKTMSNDVDTIEKFIAPHGQILIDLYFRIIHPSYPILHKKIFLEKYSRTHREFSAPLLAAVYVLAIQWWDYDPQLNRFPKPNVESILKIGLNNYLLEISKRPKLSSVQAGLLLLHCKHIFQISRNSNNSNNSNNPNGNTNTSTLAYSDYSDWILCSQVVALAEELGLGLDCDNWKLPKWERGLRKRLAWAAYMEDKWLSLKNARPSHINEINWVVVSLVEEDFPEKHGDGDLKEGSSDIDNGKKIFMNLIELSMILSDILNQFYSMRAMTEINDINQVLKIAKPLQLKLRVWYHSLPIELQMSSVQPRKLCSNGYLQLAYFATELTLHRKIVTTIYQQTMAGNPPPKELVNVCRAAARTRLLASIEFVRDLKPEHIHSFWHSSSSSNFTLIGTFAAILFISSPTKEEANFYKDQIFNYRWILKISSKGFDQVGDALSKLDLVLNYIPGLLNDSVELPMVIPNVPTVDYQQQQTQSSSNVSQHSYGMPSSSQQQFINSSGRPNTGLYGNGKINSVANQNQRIRINPQQHRMNSQQGSNSPYASPQNFTTPPFSQAQQPASGPSQQQQTAISRGGQFLNSPQSSQGLSPNEIIKLQRPIVPNSTSRNGVDQSDNNSPLKNPNHSNANSKANSPVVSRSPNIQSTASIFPQNDTYRNSDSRSFKSDKDELSGN